MYELLRGMRVIEGAAFVAGPSCGLHLSQAGADVIRFDSVAGGPDACRWPVAASGGSFYWDGLNKGKRSIAINLTVPDGRLLAQRLATSGDGMFITNYPANSFLAYSQLAATRADLICLRVMGWADGTPAVDYTINAALGLPYMTGHADDPRPVNHVLPAWDLLTGAYGAFMLIAAERERRLSGKGREIRIALSDVAAATLGHLGQVAEVITSKADRPRIGNDLFGALGRDFSTRDGHRIMVVAITARQWAALVEVLNVEAQIAALETRLGVSFKAEGERFQHRADLFSLIERAIGQYRLDDLAGGFDKAGVCWSRYQSLHQAVQRDDALFGANEIFSACTHPATGTYPTPGAAARIPQDPRGEAIPAPRLGQHTDEVLAELLGMDSGEIGRLHDSGVVA